MGFHIRLAAGLEDEFLPSESRVDTERFLAAIEAAVQARNGWKQILDYGKPAR